MVSENVTIELRNIWKIFGARAEEAFVAIKERGMSKQEVLEKYKCAIGVADVSLKIEKGEIFCVMGLSGSGKSTLVRHINRLHEPTSGEILIDGEDVRRFGAKELRRIRGEKIGMVFQHFALMPHRTVRDNVALPLETRGASKLVRLKEADRVIELVELAGWEDRYAHELSGGMQQRVGLARALAADPDILLMDEPFSALDPLIRRQLQDQFIELSAKMNKTTVFITHDLDEAMRIGNRIAIMKDGKIVQMGTAKEIIANPQDDYVRDFVSGISRLSIVHAHKIMQPLAQYEAVQGRLSSDTPAIHADQDLNAILRLATTTSGPITVQDGQGHRIGVITHLDLLKGIQGDAS